MVFCCYWLDSLMPFNHKNEAKHLLKLVWMWRFWRWWHWWRWRSWWRWWSWWRWRSWWCWWRCVGALRSAVLIFHGSDSFFLFASIKMFNMWVCVNLCVLYVWPLCWVLFLFLCFLEATRMSSCKTATRSGLKVGVGSHRQSIEGKRESHFCDHGVVLL